MELFAAGDNAAKIVIVVIGAIAFVAILAWRISLVVKGLRTKGSVEEKQKAVFGASWGKGYDLGNQLGQKLGEKLRPGKGNKN